MSTGLNSLELIINQLSAYVLDDTENIEIPKRINLSMIFLIHRDCNQYCYSDKKLSSIWQAE
jgi:hypothetical protein